MPPLLRALPYLHPPPPIVVMRGAFKEPTRGANPSTPPPVLYSVTLPSADGTGTLFGGIWKWGIFKGVFDLAAGQKICARGTILREGHVGVFCWVGCTQRKAGRQTGVSPHNQPSRKLPSGPRANPDPAVNAIPRSRGAASIRRPALQHAPFFCNLSPQSGA